MVSCVFLSHNKTSTKQSLKLIFIHQPLLVGSEINTTLKETLINITELSKKVSHNYEISRQFASLSIRGRRILSLT